ncbi:hypothetical protein BXZ70DRAFT_905240 [Cristinia sonorae]|uniref:Uncharacterized protein n=1 Tax=Cristinia sonorae TaxID=1940300 RepID=A0A8K0UWB2_9AGAR|nr:hypothetical protein BXZ70DRAFT_905240 [Cristinia sonorae]
MLHLPSGVENPVIGFGNSFSTLRSLPDMLTIDWSLTNDLRQLHRTRTLCCRDPSTTLLPNKDKARGRRKTASSLIGAAVLGLSEARFFCTLESLYDVDTETPLRVVDASGAVGLHRIVVCGESIAHDNLTATSVSSVPEGGPPEPFVSTPPDVDPSTKPERPPPPQAHAGHSARANKVLPETGSTAFRQGVCGDGDDPAVIYSSSHHDFPVAAFPVAVTFCAAGFNLKPESPNESRPDQANRTSDFAFAFSDLGVFEQ